MNGLVIHHHSRLEVLAERLAKILDEETPPHPLAAQTIVVAHSGIGQWLRRFLAARQGTRGPRVVAHLQTPLLGEYLQNEFRSRLKRQASTVFENASLALAIFSALGDHEGLQEAGNYLFDVAVEEHALQQRRWQLAERMAEIFSNYLRYRSDWIASWEAGESSHWQAVLWRRLITRHGKQHMTALLRELLQIETATSKESLHCFGFTHLPPDILNFFARRSESQKVTIYFPNPCHEFWGTIEPKRKIARAELRADATHRESGHPLLASLGGQGQAFFNLLADLSVEHLEENAAEEENTLDATAISSIQNCGLLATLQYEIRTLKNLSLTADASVNSATPPPVCMDDSLLIVAAATRLRELELLRERLLALLHQHADLKPEDIVVLSPKIEAYADLIPAVFGSAEVARLLPFRLVDRSLQNYHPLLQVGAQLLCLRESRFAVSDILTFLEQPALAQRFDFDPDELWLLLPWLKDSRVAWGLDSAFRTALNAGKDDRNTWSAALDRLWLGYFNGGETLFADRAALAAAEGQRTRLLAALDRLIGILSAARRDLERPRPLRQWGQWWQRLLDALFDADYRDPDAQIALRQLKELADDLAEAAFLTAVNEAISWPVWRDMLRSKLQASTTTPGLPAGNILFCGMAPFRSLPFRVVAILGLNDGEFPREDLSFNLDRTRRSPRTGDRCVREEDRYLFLESIMNARTALHLSYLGEDQCNGSTKPPAAPLAELIEHLHERFAPYASTLSTTQTVWYRRAPLQPFDKRHIEASEPTLRSYGGSWHNGHQQMTVSTSVSVAATDTSLPEQTINDMDTLIAFYRHPAKFYFTRCLNSRIDIGDERPGDTENLDSGLANSYVLQLQLLEEALQQGQLPEQPSKLWQARGILPSGTLGALTWQRLRGEILETFTHLHGNYTDIVRQTPQHLRIELDLGDGVFLNGQISNLRGHTLLRYRPKGTRAADRIAFFIEWAAAALTLGQPLQALLYPEFRRRIIKNKPSTFGPLLHWPLDHHQLRAALRRLIAIAESGTQHCLPLPIETAYAWFEPISPEIENRLALARAAYGLDSEENPHQSIYQHYTEAEDPYWRLRFNQRPLFERSNPELARFAELSEEIFTWTMPEAKR